MPDHGINEQPSVRAVQHEFPLQLAIVREETTGAVHANCHLLQANVGVLASANSGLSAKDIIDPANLERNFPEVFERDQPASLVSLRNKFNQVHFKIMQSKSRDGRLHLAEPDTPHDVGKTQRLRRREKQAVDLADGTRHAEHVDDLGEKSDALLGELGGDGSPSTRLRVNPAALPGIEGYERGPHSRAGRRG
jgi:hypothetical protein